LKKYFELVSNATLSLPVPYYHIIFTLPSELNSLIYSNQKNLLSIFFKAASETLKALGNDTKHLGASIGFIMVLHTWGQNLLYHPHIHCIIPAGGINSDKTEWVSPKNENFFMPVKVISDLFKKKFLAKLKKLYYNTEQPLNLIKENLYLEQPDNFNIFIKNLKEKKWVIHCTKPFKNPNIIVNYLGRYVYKVAIDSHRVIKVENDLVYFRYKDYRDMKTKIMCLKPVEFIRRILLHVLPSGFQKMRYYGFLGNNKKAENLELCRKILKVVFNVYIELLSTFKNDIKKAIIFLKGSDFNLCRVCKNGRMVRPKLSEISKISFRLPRAP
jgi:hypothetical protein